MNWIVDFIRAIPDSPQGLFDFVTGLLLAHGYLVIFLGAALDNFGLPASGDVVMFAGVGSTGQCNAPGQCSSRGVVAQSLARPHVELERDEVEVGLIVH